MGRFNKSDAAALRKANPEMRKWSDVKVVWVSNRRYRKEERQITKMRKQRHKKSK